MMQTLLLHYKDESRKGAAISLLQIYASLFFCIVCNNTFVIFQKNIIRNGISYLNQHLHYESSRDESQVRIKLEFTIL